MGTHVAEVKLRKMMSGDLCRFIDRDGYDYPLVEHYRCDDFRDGCITDPTNGQVVKHNVGSQRGFYRGDE